MTADEPAPRLSCWSARVPLLSREALDQAFPVITLALVTGAAAGALIVQRHPGYRIGWLFC